MLLALLLSASILQAAPDLAADAKDAATAAVWRDPDEPTVCDRAGSTVAMNACLGEDLAQEEARMQRYYAVALERAAAADAEPTVDGEGTRQVELLTAAQEAWTAYADLRCQGQLDEVKTGTVRTIVYVGCRIEEIRQRTHDIWVDHLTYWDTTPPLLPEPLAFAAETTETWDPSDPAASPAADAAPTVLPFCDAALPAAARCSLFGELPSRPGDCEAPSWNRRATCAVVSAVLIAEDVKDRKIDCEEAVQTHDVDACLQMNAMWEGARMESYFEEALGAAYQDARLNLDLAAEGSSVDPYNFNFIVDLRETQQMWETYAERVCSSVGEQYFGGSIRFSAMNACHAELTRERTRALWAYSQGGVQGQRPEPSGPVSEADVQGLLARHSVDRDRVLRSRPVEGPAH